jgi:hypothetical protein
MKRALLWSLVFSPFLLVSTVTAQPGAGAGAGRAERPERIGPTLRQTPLGRIVSGDDTNANDTQRRLQELLQQYPPSLGRVLALDPTLLSNDAYLQPYPQLATFLAQHPEIAHNPSYFFDQQYRDVSRRQYDYNDPKIAAIRAIDQTLGGLAAMLVGLTVIGTAAWLIRSAIEYRKWLRVSKTHVDTHAKLMDRLTSNEDLVAYMQSPAGRRFLEAAPIPLEAGPRALSAPLGRILWSVQAGIVVAFLGGALMYSSLRVGSSEWFSEGELPLFIIGACALAIGAGFFVSAFVSWGLSHRLGLFRSNGSSDSATGTPHVS